MRNILLEYKKMNDTLENIFSFLFSLVNHVELDANFQKSKQWLIESLEYLLSQKFANTELLLTENVSL